jgi:hypothetical protein
VEVTTLKTITIAGPDGPEEVPADNLGVNRALGPIGYRVVDGDTGDALSGEAGEDLIRASFAEPEGTGAVLAYRDDDGLWRHVHAAGATGWHRGRDLRTVYVIGQDRVRS